MTIYFKTKSTIDISQEIAEVIAAKLNKGCEEWLVFKDKNDVTFLIINLSEVEFIGEN
jgi:anti-anti-sigma regulatory factor